MKFFFTGYSRFILICAFGFLFYLAVYWFAGKYEVEVWFEPPIMKQGQPSACYVNSTRGLKSGSMLVLGQDVSLYHVSPTRLRGIYGVGVGEEPGEKRLSATVTPRWGRRKQVAAVFQVNKVKFPRGKVSLPSKSSRLLGQPALFKADRETMRATISSATPVQMWAGLFTMPLKHPQISSVFGKRRVYNNGRAAWQHMGVDMEASEGLPVRASNVGTVALSTRVAINGNTVVIDHGQGVFTQYNHLSRRLVQAGQKVAQGELIGRVGSTGLSEGPHLHWGMSINGVLVDPMVWTKKVPE